MLKVFVRCVQLEAEKRMKPELLRAKLRGEVSQADYAQVNAEFDIEIAVTAHPGLIWLRAPAFHARGHGFESRGPVAARHYFETERVHPQGALHRDFPRPGGMPGLPPLDLVPVVLQNNAYQLAASSNSSLGKELLKRGFDGAFGDTDPRRNFLVRQAFENK